MSQPQPSVGAVHDVAQLRHVEHELRQRVQGEVRFDARARALYSTDASPYEIEPLGVVVPRSIDDVKAAVAVAHEHGVPVLPRGGGTSLAGQTVARALVLDVSKYLTNILEFDAEQRWVRVEPGVVRDQLNDYLAPHRLQFTPDISTTNRANVGGMVANNSAGTRSIKYGMTVDAVMAMTVLLMDGTVLELGPLDARALAAKLTQDGREGDVYRTVHTIVTEHATEIAERYPKVMRRVGGYNLDAFGPDRPFNLAKLVCGSEGTLAVILDVTLALQPVPRHRVMAMVHFDTLDASLQAVQYINRHGPSAVEILDRDVFKLGAKNPNLKRLLGWLQGDPAAVLLVEFDGETEAEMMAGVQSLQADAQVNALRSTTYLATEASEQHDILEFRRGGLGIYSTVKGAHKPTPFVEDAAIPVEHLPKYIPAVAAVCERHGVHAVFYGHASVGVIHVRPHLDLKNADGVAAYESISREVFELVQQYGGSWSGEHGDGLIRSYKNRELFGDVLYEDFRTVKRAFDPDGLLNPGKVVDAPAMTENLRYGADYPADPIKTYFDFSGDGGYLGAIEMCTGVGACRKVDTGTMCPSYMATRDEDHSTRGRANVLRDAINGRMPGGMTSKDVYDVLDLCLECKACKAECPSQVDMAKIKYEFLQHYYDEHGTPLSALAIGNVARVAPLAQRLAPLANALLPTKAVRWVIEKVIKVDKRRIMPRYARQSFDRWFEARMAAAMGRDGGAAESDGFVPNTVEATAGTPAAAGAAPAARRRVALYADTWTMFNETGPGKAAVRVLEALGYDVELVPYGCCGRPQISKGLLKDAKKVAQSNVARLKPYIERGVPVVGLEPSCITAFVDDYRDLVPGADTDAVAENIWMIDEFLAKAWTRGELHPAEVFEKGHTDLMLHGHCQQKAILGTRYSKALLEWVSDDVAEIDAGCCGMAGSFGYGHYDVSMTVGESRLFPAVRAHEGETVACGFSCRHQIHDGTGKNAKHIVEVLADALRSPN